MTSGWRRAQYFRIFDVELVSKPAISLKKSSRGGGYRRTTQEGLQSNYTHVFC